MTEPSPAAIQKVIAVIQNAPDTARVLIEYPSGTDAFDIKALKELVGKVVADSPNGGAKADDHN